MLNDLSAVDDTSPRRFLRSVSTIIVTIVVGICGDRVEALRTP